MTTSISKEPLFVQSLTISRLFTFARLQQLLITTSAIKMRYYDVDIDNRVHFTHDVVINPSGPVSI